MKKILVFIIFTIFVSLGCHNESETHITDDIYLEKDSAENVYIITRKISDSFSSYIVVGDVQWVAKKNKYIFGYKKSYKTNTFLETESSFYFVILNKKDVNSESYIMKEFPDANSMRAYLESNKCLEPYTHVFRK